MGPEWQYYNHQLLILLSPTNVNLVAVMVHGILEHIFLSCQNLRLTSMTLESVWERSHVCLLSWYLCRWRFLYFTHCAEIKITCCQCAVIQGPQSKNLWFLRWDSVHFSSPSWLWRRGLYAVPHWSCHIYFSRTFLRTPNDLLDVDSRVYFLRYSCVS